MAPALYFGFVGAVIVLMLVPGPNVALITATSMARGVRAGLVTVAGTSTAMVLQLILVAAGLSAMFSATAAMLEWIRWAGVAYLLYLAVRTWRAPPFDINATQPDVSRTFWRGCLVSLTNPKTLLFYGAFFPQFIDQSQPMAPQLALLAATFLVIAVLIDSLWALAASQIRRVLAGRRHAPNRIAAVLYTISGLGLALARKS